MIVNAFVAVLAMSSVVRAAPPRRLYQSSTLQPRQSSSSSGFQTGGGLSVQVWAPLVAVVLVILAMILIACVRRRRSTTSVATQVTATRELTAEQLTGTVAARPRRTRRTPSQISTRSLPAYMEDPGDTELVLARGTADMQDPMPTLSEDHEHPSSFSVSQADLNNLSIADLSMGFTGSTTSHTPLLNANTAGQPQPQSQSQAQSQGEPDGQARGQSENLTPSQGQVHRHSESIQDRSTTYPLGTAGAAAGQRQSLLRRVSTRSRQADGGLSTSPGMSEHAPSTRGEESMRESMDTERTVGGSGSEDSQHALLSGVGWGLAAVYGAEADGGVGGAQGEGGAAGEGNSGSGAGRVASGRGRGSVYGSTRGGGFELSAEELQARGDAPPYAEVVLNEGGMEMTTMQTGEGGASTTAGATADVTGGTTVGQRRRSGFRSFAARLSQLMPSTSSHPTSSSTVTSPPPVPALPAGTTSAQSTLRATSTRTSTQDSTPPLPVPFPPRNTHTRHRSTTSGSGSTNLSVTSASSPPLFLHAHARSTSTLDNPNLAGTLGESTTSLLAPSRSRSRLALANLFNSNASHTSISRPGSSQSTHANGVNPNANLSTTSLTSSLISSPIPHTLVRTAFVYPSAGPTTEQMRFISSRENVARFGVPYGRPAEEQAERNVGAGGWVGRQVDEEDPPPFDWNGEGGGGGVQATGEGEAGDETGNGDRTGDADAGVFRPPSEAVGAAPYVAPKRQRRSTGSSVGSFESVPDEAYVVQETPGDAGEDQNNVTTPATPTAGGGVAPPRPSVAVPMIITDVSSPLHSSPGTITATATATTFASTGANIPANGTANTNTTAGDSVDATDAAKSVLTPPPTPTVANGPGNGNGDKDGSMSEKEGGVQAHKVVPRIEVAPSSPM